MPEKSAGAGRRPLLIDANARHMREADLAVNLSGAKPADSYLRIDALIAAAKATDAAHLEGNAELVGGHDFRQNQPYKGGRLSGGGKPFARLHCP